MGYGCGGGDAANDRKKEQVVEDYKQQVSFDWKSETEDRAYCFGSEWPEILWLDVPRAIGPFQDRVELRYISFIEARVIPVDFAWRTRLFLLKLGVRLLCGKQGPGWEHMFIMKFFHCTSMLSRQHRPKHIQEICHQLPQGPASSTQDILCPKPYRIMPSLISAVGMTASNFSLQY
ncbi:uncharacterized protein LOC125532282 isoform X3 [Triticum urartu]|uniref:uncharacterized protein LOC125532282 isoform X3 n=1 Tax=Triticum urartu TaxID=4572 RepID=UPI0020438F02|nr:uncharacterized protein LOC125532282 isoform X3 [Triticum urartu]XP_048552368.1 uncharacterized protein LOC125532282 isoform X3 [Triticum urartu]XP_048552369.1 uncharacterized protein LOC125532282 isoform X3 [Triticum urartu]XP_048552370.1 uncharacterized protein LOC125532282 isoform X3 [Triticum urartu]XP_048552371.1 uncharacterized protein LOC125532282 isoform X3 [Triticum urartu]XP_048552372.1 uncharacterized protein LOC125532282 isoform X3 [Triticum urartu]